MKARLEAWLEVLGDEFWLRPAAMVFLCVAAAQGAVEIEVLRPSGGAKSSTQPWFYSGGAEGARAMLGAVASSSISIAQYDLFHHNRGPLPCLGSDPGQGSCVTSFATAETSSLSESLLARLHTR